MTEYPTQPRVAVGAVVIRDGRVLLVRRAQPPALDLWAIPGGSVELGETLQEAAEREMREETGMAVRAGAPIHAFDAVVRDRSGRVRFHYVVVDLRAEHLHGDPAPADDVHDARWFSATDFPTDNVSDATVDLLRRIGFLEDLDPG